MTKIQDPKIFSNSEGCKLIKPNGNQRFAPLISRPTIITKIIKTHTTIKQCSEYFFQISVGVIAQTYLQTEPSALQIHAFGLVQRIRTLPSTPLQRPEQ